MDANAPKFRKVALVHVAKGWLCGPQGELIFEGKATSSNPACRFGVQQPDKLRAVDDLKKSLTNEATAIHFPPNLPSWGHVAQMCTLLSSRGGERPIAMAKADHAYACRQLPLLEKDEFAAVVALKNPPGGL